MINKKLIENIDRIGNLISEGNGERSKLKKYLKKAIKGVLVL